MEILKDLISVYEMRVVGLSYDGPPSFKSYSVTQLAKAIFDHQLKPYLPQADWVKNGRLCLFTLYGRGIIDVGWSSVIGHYAIIRSTKENRLYKGIKGTNTTAKEGVTLVEETVPFDYLNYEIIFWIVFFMYRYTKEYMTTKPL